MRLRGESLALLPALGFIVLFALLPALALFASSVAAEGGAPGILQVLRDPVNAQAVVNSFEQGGLSAVGAVAVGYPAGVLLGRYEFVGRRTLFGVLLVPFLLPALIVVAGVGALFGGGGLISQAAPITAVLGRGIPGIVTVNVVFNAPIVALLTATGVAGASPELEETVATLGGSPTQRFRDVWGPASSLGAIAGGLLTFLFSALAFAAPLLICGARCYTLEARVYTLDQTFVQPHAAGVLALVMVLLVLPPAAAYVLLAQRLRARTRSARDVRRRIPWRSPLAWPALAITLAFFGIIALVLGAVVVRSVQPGRGAPALGEGWATLFGPAVTSALGISAGGALANTLLFAALAAGIALVLGVVGGFAYGGARTTPRIVPFVLFLPLVISPVVLSFSLATFWRPLLGGASTVWALIVVSQATLALPFAFQVFGVALGRLSPQRRDAARLLGASPFAAYLDIEVPLARRGLVTAALFALAIALGEFTATYFLATARFTTLPVALYRLLALRATAPANALAGLLVVLTLVVFFVIARRGERVSL
ncbi:MAG: ABC transporter permease subunit [Thermoplasmata archaeon]|nr:ABC transporter permease subunit [Thermoplasmata archaeon]